MKRFFSAARFQLKKQTLFFASKDKKMIARIILIRKMRNFTIFDMHSTTEKK